MNRDAYRTVWAARAAGAIGGGPTLLVGLAMAEDATTRHGELTAGVRALARLCGLSASTTGRAVRALVLAGVVEAENGTGRHATRYRFAPAVALPTRDAKVGDNGAVALPERDTSESLALPERDTRPDVALPERDANVPRARDENASARALDTPTHPLRGGVCGGGGVSGTQAPAEPRPADQGDYEAEQHEAAAIRAGSGAAARARYEAELTPAEDVPGRVAELRAAVDAEPEPLPAPPADERPEDVTAPEDIPAQMRYVRERGGLIRGRGE